MTSPSDENVLTTDGKTSAPVAVIAAVLAALHRASAVVCSVRSLGELGPEADQPHVVACSRLDNHPHDAHAEPVHIRTPTQPLRDRRPTARTNGALMETPMKFFVTVDGRKYEVEVESAEPIALASAASRVEGAPHGPPPTRANGNGSAAPSGAPTANHNRLHQKANPAASVKPVGRASAPLRAPMSEAKSTSSSAVAADTSSFEVALPPMPRPHADTHAPWHGLTLGAAGECLAPVPGVVKAIRATVGASVRVGEPLLDIEFARGIATGEEPIVGTVRAADAGMVNEVLVRPGDSVAFGQPLLRIHLNP